MKKVQNAICLLIFFGGIYLFKSGFDSKFRSPELPPVVYRKPLSFPQESDRPMTERIYTIKEFNSILKTSPQQLEGRDVYLDAYVADVLLGRGCNSFAVLIDPSNAELYKRSNAPDLTEEEKKLIPDIQVIRSGSLDGYHKTIYPTVRTVFKGRFNAPATQKCPDGNKRFTIEEIENEFKKNADPAD